MIFAQRMTGAFIKKIEFRARKNALPAAPEVLALLGRYVLCGILLLLNATPALAELMLYPSRIVIEGNARAAHIQLINSGTESETYRISVVNRRMSETGLFLDIEQPLPGEQFSGDMLRFSPRQVTLAPGATQTVRIMVRKTANLAPGEYRSHLLFSQQPKATASNNVETHNDTHKKGIGVVITALIGASVPVIVRHGNLEASLVLSHLELQQAQSGTPLLALWMERGGNKSVYGDLTIKFTPKGGAEKIIGRANGVAVYTPNALRRVQVALERPNGMALANGNLSVTFHEQVEAGGKLMGEATLQVP